MNIKKIFEKVFFIIFITIFWIFLLFFVRGIILNFNFDFNFKKKENFILREKIIDIDYKDEKIIKNWWKTIDEKFKEINHKNIEYLLVFVINKKKENLIFKKMYKGKEGSVSINPLLKDLENGFFLKKEEKIEIKKEDEKYSLNIFEDSKNLDEENLFEDNIKKLKIIESLENEPKINFAFLNNQPTYVDGFIIVHNHPPTKDYGSHSVLDASHDDEKIYLGFEKIMNKKKIYFDSLIYKNDTEDKGLFSTKEKEIIKKNISEEIEEYLIKMFNEFILERKWYIKKKI